MCNHDEVANIDRNILTGKSQGKSCIENKNICVCYVRVKANRLRIEAMKNTQIFQCSLSVILPVNDLLLPQN